MGALNSEIHLEKVTYYAHLATEEGGKIAYGYGSSDMPRLPSKGYFFPPTIVTGLTNNSRCMREEIFGPIVCIDTFRTEQEAIEKGTI